MGRVSKSIQCGSLLCVQVIVQLHNKAAPAILEQRQPCLAVRAVLKPALKHEDTTAFCARCPERTDEAQRLALQ